MNITLKIPNDRPSVAEELNYGHSQVSPNIFLLRSFFSLRIARKFATVLNHWCVSARFHGCFIANRISLLGRKVCHMRHTNVINWLFFFLVSTCFICISPPSVVMSQYTFNGFPLFSGSIQYSPSPLESPESWISLQEWAALREYQPFPLIENKKRYLLLARDGDIEHH